MKIGTYTFNDSGTEKVTIRTTGTTSYVAADAVKFSDQGAFHISTHSCRYCLHCVTSCPVHAIEHNPVGWKYFQEGMAAATKAVLDTFEPGRVYYLTMLTQITPLCDCWGFTTPGVPDALSMITSTGAAATVIVTVATLLSAVPSFALYVKLSVPT